ncbi:MAG: hypothetical protein CL933_16925 [Deltaproteobacteria bacterium]|nr:hypothetical protein [Deltaproteobacteria bacterium]
MRERLEPLNSTHQQLIEVRACDKRRARELSLVLFALRIPHKLHSEEGQVHILVPEEHVVRAQDELQQYTAEGPLRAERPPPPDVRAGRSAAAIWTLTLILTHSLSIYGPYLLRSRTAISVASLIREGEWWRTITSLTLHADHLHLLSNLIFGSLLVGILAAEAGLGTALLLTLLGGALGNTANALFGSELHRSLGASTAVFASLGVLVGARFRADRAGPARARAWIPLLAGLVLLGWLGGPSERMGVNGIIRTDVPAHVFGLLAGLSLGLAFLRPGSRFRRQGLQLAGAALLLVAAWAAWALSDLQAPA